MQTRTKYLFVAFCLVLAAWSLQYIREYPFSIDADEVTLIAHAGGVVSGITSSNSIEALDKSANAGFRYFELDFSWTSAGELVAIHDWHQTAVNLFPGFTGRPATASEFVRSPMIGGLRPVDLTRLNEWMNLYPDAWVITDIKSNNVDGLSQMKVSLGANIARVIPQIYHPLEYDQVRSLGYRHIIFTLYKSNLSPISISSFVLSHELWALTVPKERMIYSTWLKYLRLLGVRIFTHTVNDPGNASILVKYGAVGFYTDTMQPGERYSLPVLTN